MSVGASDFPLSTSITTATAATQHVPDHVEDREALNYIYTRVNAPTTITSAATPSGGAWKIEDDGTGGAFFVSLYATSGDTNPVARFGIGALALPRLDLGPGGSTATDVHFYRDSTSHLHIGASSGIEIDGSLLSTNASGGVGYKTGAGGAVTQATNKSTDVTLNTITGQITTNAQSIASGSSFGFTVANSTVAAGDVVSVSIGAGSTTAAGSGWGIFVDKVAAGSFHVWGRNFTAGALAEAFVINFAVLRAVAS